MPTLGAIVREARLKARLDEPLMARLAGLDLARLRLLETGEAELRADELDAYARVFGTSVRQLLAGQSANGPLSRLYYRSAVESSLPSIGELADHRGQHLIGEFLRCANDVAELRQLTTGRPPQPLTEFTLHGPVWERSGRPLPSVTSAPNDLTGVPPYGAEEMAAALRRELGLGVNPIDSMIALLEGLGVSIFWTTPEELTPVIDGASTTAPVPAVLVNLVEGSECWWRTRMTLAHELCHLLVDHPAAHRDLAIFSPRAEEDEPRSRWRLFEGFERIEARASAFAAHLLAPSDGVREIASSFDPTTEPAVTAVCQRFGIGRLAALYRLKHVFGFDEKTRLRMRARTPSHRHARDHADCFRGALDLRGGLLAELALTAFAKGQIDAVRVREYLGISLTEEIPPHATLSAAQRAPLRRIEDRVRSIALQHLQEQTGSSTVILGQVSRGPRGWEIEVLEVGEGHVPAPCGSVIVSFDLNVVDAAAAA